MHIKNFIKMYPITICSGMILVVCISLLFLPHRIHAQTQGSNEENNPCKCITNDCPTGTPQTNSPCSQKGNGCYCPTFDDTIYYGACQTTSATKCKRIKGCGKCTPYDCNPLNPCYGDGICKKCKEFKLNENQPCIGIKKDDLGTIITCGTCNIVIKETNYSVV